MKYTTEQKKQYYKQLRSKWTMMKLMADQDNYARVIYEKSGLKVSYYGFYYVLMQMKKLRLEGMPYVDCKTYDGWLKSGFKVAKGQKSKIDGITWIEIKDKEASEDEEPEFLLPKIYHLFHKTQVEKR